MSDNKQEDKTDSFFKYVMEKLRGKIEEEVISDIFNYYKEFLNNFTIMSNEDVEEIDKNMNDYEEKIKLLNSQKEIDSDKIQSMKTELANNINLNEKYKKLNEEYNTLKQKYNVCYNDNTGFQMKIKNDEKLIKDLQTEITNVKKENFEKFEKITELEKDFKLNEIKLNQATEKINKLSMDNNDLTMTNKELRNNYLDQQKNYQNKLLVLEKQLKNLTEANNNFVQENNEVQIKLKDFQMYTNMAKVNKKDLNPEDFSILETMSKRAESAELEVQRLLTFIEELKALNEKLRNKIKPLEDYALLQIKHDHEINTGIDTIYDLKNKIFTDEEKTEIDKLKNDPNQLLQSLIKLKTENLELHNQLKDITIECNQQLREAKRK